ncbi:MAG TPA: arylsulfotransferase family protein [Solirubrobacteraceae bacterium]|nr:arylsulfotransferase family protein [Solirubrobacteraceae bacterium]
MPRWAIRALTLALLAAFLSACAGKGPYHPRAGSPEADVVAAAADAASVSPLPGTVDASPQTQISFLGPRGMRVSGVRVVGSLSGVHTGVLRAYSTGTGASFLPNQPFRAGERVTVTAHVGRRSTRPAGTTFTVAAPAAVSEAEFPREPGDANAVQHHSSAPELTPSRVTVTTPAQPGATPGDFFLAPYQGEGSAGPMIVDQAGELVWSHPLAAEQEATNFGVQRYRGRPVLVWWQGRIIQAGFGLGEDVIYDSSYRQVASVRAGNGYAADLHVIRLTPHGTAWIDAFAPVEEDLTAVHGASRAVLTDSVVQEIDVATGLVMWEWHALGHLPLEESQSPLATHGYPWDYAHVNSVDPGPSGDILISARGTWALYDVDIHSGGVRWRLGGSRSSFKLGPGVAFYWQHDARFQGAERISLFDNGSEPPKEKQSRGLVLSLSAKTHSVSLASQYVNPKRTLLSNSQGSMSELAGGNWLLGYGRLPDFTEFGPDGRVLFDATLGSGVQDFSVGLSQWVGHPLTRPSVLARRRARDRVEVRVSWNGATEVRSWRVLAGRAPQELSAVATVPRSGFETAIAARASDPYLAVQALDRSGRVIAVSAVARP